MAQQAQQELTSALQGIITNATIAGKAARRVASESKGSGKLFEDLPRGPSVTDSISSTLDSGSVSSPDTLDAMPPQGSLPEPPPTQEPQQARPQEPQQAPALQQQEPLPALPPPQQPNPLAVPAINHLKRDMLFSRMKEKKHSLSVIMGSACIGLSLLFMLTAIFFSSFYYIIPADVINIHEINEIEDGFKIYTITIETIIDNIPQTINKMLYKTKKELNEGDKVDVGLDWYINKIYPNIEDLNWIKKKHYMIALCWGIILLSSCGIVCFSGNKVRKSGQGFM